MAEAPAQLVRFQNTMALHRAGALRLGSFAGASSTDHRILRLRIPFVANPCGRFVQLIFFTGGIGGRSTQAGPANFSCWYTTKLVWGMDDFAGVTTQV